MHTAVPSTATSRRHLVPAALFIRRRDSQMWLSRDERDLLKLPVCDAERLAVVESFVFVSDIEGAYERYAGRRTSVASARLRDIDGLLDGSAEGWCRVRAGYVSMTLRGRSKVDLTELSRETSCVLEVVSGSVLGHPDGDAPHPPMSPAVFDRVVGELVDEGVLCPRPGDIEFGDFKRCWPFSYRFGADRGSPVDRYYLKKFRQAIHPRVRGRCLEIGGALTNNTYYRFDVDEFRTLEVVASVADDLVGDAADPNVFAPDTWDSILAFHVLEHCPDPFTVTDNIRTWLKPGGHVFVVVPCAQRVHNYPGDYWRFMPDGLRLLFKNFSEVWVSAYGNPLALVSSYLGVSHTELAAADMEFTHPDYPVLACAVARK